MRWPGPKDAAAGLLIGLQVFGAPLMAKSLRVGVSGSAPFVMTDQDSDGYSGISLDIWRRVAEENDLAYTLIEQKSPEAGITALADRTIDVLVGPISITARRLALPEVDFTQPYYLGKSAVLVPLKPANLASRLQVLFGWAVLSSILVLISVLMGVGCVIWLTERRDNPEQFPPGAAPGIANGTWFALVTLTTVGYGDKAPVTRLGRAITSVWMVISLIAVSSLTAGLASAFTLVLSGVSGEEITDQLGLRGQRIAAVNGSSGMELADRRNLRIVPSDSLQEGIDHLLNGHADALIFDRPALRYHLKMNPQLPLKVAPFTLAEETYGFALRSDDPLRTSLDVSILKLQRQGKVESIANTLLN